MTGLVLRLINHWKKSPFQKFSGVGFFIKPYRTRLLSSDRSVIFIERQITNIPNSKGLICKMAQKYSFYISLLWSFCFLLIFCYKYITPSGLRILYFMSLNPKTYPCKLHLKGFEGGKFLKAVIFMKAEPPKTLKRLDSRLRGNDRFCRFY